MKTLKDSKTYEHWYPEKYSMSSGCGQKRPDAIHARDLLHTISIEHG